MKKIALQGINIYQVFLHTILANIVGVNSFCRFDVTCSNYAKESINKHGVLSGGKMAVARFLKCQPFYKEN